MGPCRDSFNRWYFDVERSTCLPFVYGGCAGNMNRFKTYDTCINFCSAAIDAARSSPPTGFSFFLEHFRVLVKASCPLRCLVCRRPIGQFRNFSTHFPTFDPLQVRERTKLMSDLWKSPLDKVSTFRKIPILALSPCPSAVAFGVLTALKGIRIFHRISTKFSQSIAHEIIYEILYISAFGPKSIRVTVRLKKPICVQRHLLRNE